MSIIQHTDVIVIGAGAAGFMCAIQAAKRDRRVILLDHANKPGKKILMSGGGRCNFTNIHISPANYVSHNPHFCKSALKRYTQWDYIDWIKQHQIPFHEKKHGQLFCDNKAKDIVNMLLLESERAGVALQLNESISLIEQIGDNQFQLSTNQGYYRCQSLVIATGGLSIPTLGASGLGYQVAQQFAIPVMATRASLVPFTLPPQELLALTPLSGISCDTLITSQKQSFRENLLFTHRGLSGPAVLQISNYWDPGEEICINLLPEHDLFLELKEGRKQHPKRSLKEFLAKFLPKRLVSALLPTERANQPLQSFADVDFSRLTLQLQQWNLKPAGTEGYRTAEVTLGGIDCNAISSKTMESLNVKGLYFIGEVLDVTGWLGGYNFQWAWSSGWAAGQVC